MTESRQPESQPGCKVILFHRQGGEVRFGVVDEAGAPTFPTVAFPDLFAIDAGLLAFGREALGLTAPHLHHRFVERPHPAGWLFYLLEEQAPPAPASPVHWRHLAGLRERLGQEEQKALARAIRYLTSA